MLVSEQVLSFAMEIADRFLIHRRGRVRLRGDASQVDTAKIHAYLTV